MATREIFIQAREGTDIRNPLQLSLTDNTPLRLSQVTRRDVLDFRIRFVEGDAFTPWSGAEGYTLQLAVGTPGTAPLVVATSGDYDADEHAFDLSLDLNVPAIESLFAGGVTEVRRTWELRISGPSVTRRTFLQGPLTIVDSVFAD